jgi:hypothetical protein
MKPVFTTWTVVIIGRWNVSIFNPDWLGRCLFDNKELLVDFPMEPGLPLRITGDNVLFIPHSDRIVFGAREGTDPYLRHMEALAVKLLGILPHTPIMAVGVNFGYEVEPVPEEIRRAFRNPHSDGFVTCEIETLSKSFKWGCRHRDQVINMEFELGRDKLLVKFNFHSDSENADKAIAAINDKIVAHRILTESILDKVYDIRLEEA